EARDGIACLKKMGELLGEDNLIYRAAIDGINAKMNTEMEKAFQSERIFECFVSEALLSCLRNGYYVDITDIKNQVKHEHYKKVILEYAERCGIK
ncbi:MAG: hypothetical protein J6I45_03940, partial [Clostridia bacterium]|nr:hypothetical protein [Clostridia bacterium]